MVKTTRKRKEPVHRMSQQEIKDWEELYEYVRTNVLGYDKSQSLNQYTCLRLKGLLSGRTIENYHLEAKAHYTYKVILTTFKYCNQKIQSAFKNYHFNDEKHKINYIMKVVEDNINTVYMKLKQAKNTEKKVEQIDTSYAENYVNNFKPVEETPWAKNLKDLW